MFTPQQKRYIYENSVKVNDQNKYIQIMSYYNPFFKKAKKNSLLRYIEFVVVLLIVLYLVCSVLFVSFQSIQEAVFKMSAVFVGALLVYKVGKFILDYLDDYPIVEKIQRKECDLLCYTGDLNDVIKSINYGTSSALQNYFIVVSGNKLQIDRKNYKILLEHKGKVIKIYYFAELLQRQIYITDGAVIMVEE